MVTMLYDVTLFQNLLLPSLKSHNQCCDHTIRYDCVTNYFNPNPRVLKIENEINQKEIKMRIRK